MTNTESEAEYERHGGFPRYGPASPGPGFARFLEAARRFQDLAVSTDPDEAVWNEAADRIEAINALLEPFWTDDQGQVPAGRSPELPGFGSLLIPPWSLTRFEADGCEMRGHFTRFHVGGNHAVHGGVLPLLFDHLLGLTSHAASRPISRTAFLHVDYRNVTPINVPLVVRSRITSVEGRKAFVSAELIDDRGPEEILLAEANGLMVKLLPGQP